ncbi:MAG TPA: class I SAM-dependent methyltransferase [Methylomirabilota bacterium]|jgi:2-polyprenyl-3-methyl-5-hydroxy-6-metoxy-1,4-benzoquinol methylase|nr:class I SAM-dependent methyltransferase [Methylomirabilota bacterium]
MSVPLVTRLKGLFLRTLSRITNRHAVLLPAEAGRDDALIDLRAPYRVTGTVLTVDLRETGSGRLSATLLGYEGHFPVRVLWTGEAREYPGPRALGLDLVSGAVRLGGSDWGRVPLPFPGRRFCWKLRLVALDGRVRERLTGHYVPLDVSAVGREYFEGENYVDHEAQSAADHLEIVRLLRAHGARAPVLEIGCATGGLLAALDAEGLTGVGVDISEWAIARAAERLGPGRTWVCDFEKDELPAAITARRPFGTLVLAAVLEHFREPFAVLARLTPLAAPGTVLVISTTNRDSLSQMLFGSEWEGHFDWTHRSVDQISARTLRAELSALGWRIERLTTDLVWDISADPTRATVREWWATDARFRRLLAERELGDIVTCVAVKA